MFWAQDSLLSLRATLAGTCMPLTCTHMHMHAQTHTHLYHLSHMHAYMQRCSSAAKQALAAATLGLSLLREHAALWELRAAVLIHFGTPAPRTIALLPPGKPKQHAPRQESCVSTCMWSNANFGAAQLVCHDDCLTTEIFPFTRVSQSHHGASCPLVCYIWEC